MNQAGIKFKPFPQTCHFHPTPDKPPLLMCHHQLACNCGHVAFDVLSVLFVVNVKIINDCALLQAVCCFQNRFSHADWIHGLLAGAPGLSCFQASSHLSMFCCEKNANGNTKPPLTIQNRLFAQTIFKRLKINQIQIAFLPNGLPLKIWGEIGTFLDGFHLMYFARREKSEQKC